MFWQTRVVSRGLTCGRAVALLVLLQWATALDSRPLPTAIFGGVVAIADGERFTIIRGAAVETATKGVTLAAGDIIETGTGAFLAIEMPGGSLLGIGPSTRLYLMQRTDTPTIVVLSGWVKVDIRSKAAPIRVLGPRMGVQSRQAVVVLYTDQRTDEVFDETGSGTLLIRDDAATRTGRETQTNQFFVREERSDPVTQPRPAADFVARMPIPFRDPLPEHASAKLNKKASPQVVRAVDYSDVESWINMPRDWRWGFITRFRGRLKDPAFFAAMDAHMSQHPEWHDILHPPPPPDEDVPPGPRERSQSSPPHAPPQTSQSGPPR
jgi:hypothetical protein